MKTLEHRKKITSKLAIWNKNRTLKYFKIKFFLYLKIANVMFYKPTLSDIISLSADFVREC